MSSRSTAIFWTISPRLVLKYHVKITHADFGERRHLRQRLDPLRRGDAERADFAGLDQRLGRRHVAEHHLDVAGGQIGQRRRAGRQEDVQRLLFDALLRFRSGIAK
jgi:hypothetical protein